MNKEISFKSKIKFVSKYEFVKVIKKNTSFSKHAIDYNATSSIRFADRFYTGEIRTCTGGGIISPHKKACGFHIFDDEQNNNSLICTTKEMLKQFKTKPSRALLIGAKGPLLDCPYSIKNFEKLYKYLKDEIAHITIFKTHRAMYSESNFYYSLKDDTWIINTIFEKNNKNCEVTTLKNLRTAFKKIKISKGDKLFIENKEIHPEECPKMFEEKSKNIKIKNQQNYFVDLIKKIFSKFE